MAQAIQRNPPAILVVDDNPATRYSTSRVLRSAGLTVVEASNGVEALARAMDAPDLVVLDINLPDIDGFDVCRELRASPRTRRTPVIYLSASFVDDIHKVHAVDAGGDGYLTHPVEPPVLLATVHAFLRARRAEDARHTSEAQFKTVFDVAPNGIALLSSDWLFLDVNPAMCRLLGRPRDAIVGSHISAFTPRGPALADPFTRDNPDASHAWVGTMPMLNAAGQQIDLEWNVSVYAVPGIRLAIVNDITERKLVEAERERLLESERLARAEAEQANKLKDDFLAALSHELRTPLNTIVGWSRLLRDRPVADDPEVRAGIEAIERNARIQAQLIADLLDISRITSGKLQLDRQWLRLADAVAAVVAGGEASAQAKDVEIALHVTEPIDDVFWDPARLQQVVWNLLDNAIKFSKPRGVVRVGVTQSDDHVELRVCDDGRGISAEFLPYVFERFRQEESGSRRWHGGLGLGLSIVHQLVTGHGATVTATSEGEGKGACFLVRIPRMQVGDQHARERATAMDDRPLRSVRVLVVEDNEDARALVRRILVDAGAEVRDVADVESALAVLEPFQPALLVSDLGMPLQSGYDLIRRVRQAGWPATRLPAIAVTAFARDEDRERALHAGYQSHCAKPLNVSRFLSQARTLLQAE
jgi:PAS domain S-box-containing protein